MAHINPPRPSNNSLTDMQNFRVYLMHVLPDIKNHLEEKSSGVQLSIKNSGKYFKHLCPLRLPSASADRRLPSGGVLDYVAKGTYGIIFRYTINGVRVIMKAEKVITDNMPRSEMKDEKSVKDYFYSGKEKAQFESNIHSWAFKKVPSGVLGIALSYFCRPINFMSTRSQPKPEYDKFRNQMDTFLYDNVKVSKDSDMNNAIYGYMLQQQLRVYIMEEAKHDLTRHILNPTRADGLHPSKELYSILLQVVATLYQLQSIEPRFRHNDLHTGNILMCKRGHKSSFRLGNIKYAIYPSDVTPVISDFGLATTPAEQNTKAVYGKAGISTDENHFYDIHTFFNAVDLVIRSSPTATPMYLDSTYNYKYKPLRDVMESIIGGLRVSSKEQYGRFDYKHRLDKYEKIVRAARVLKSEDAKQLLKQHEPEHRKLERYKILMNHNTAKWLMYDLNMFGSVIEKTSRKS